MTVSVVLVGSALLIVLAVLAGGVDRWSRDDAWRRVADQRRANSEERQRLAAILDTLVRDAGTCQCRVCRTIRRLSGQDGDPQDRA